MAKQKTALTLSMFDQQLKKVLKYFDEPARIGAESPLASPYFLSHALREATAPNSEQVRGEILCNEIRQAAATLWGGPLPKSGVEFRAALPEIRQMAGTPRYAYAVLELRCFQQLIKLRRTADIWEGEEYLPGSQAEHYRDFDVAITHLSQALLRRLHPTLRPEQPAAPKQMIGYDVYLDQALAALSAGQTVSLHGPGGVGKTTLGTAIFHRFVRQPIFWYTFRTTLNDRVSSLLFALGHFLYQQGASNLWQFLVVAGGAITDYNLALALLREDLAALQPNAPLLCFDELDCLALVDPDQRPLEHTQLLQLLESLRGLVPLLLISQQALLEADLYLTPQGLTSGQLQRLFQGAELTLSDGEAQRLHQYTAGNPRLLVLCLALYQSGDRLSGDAPDLTKIPGFTALYQRLWQRLTTPERQLLQRLAVFRSPAPVDGWGEEQALLTGLVNRRLLFLDGQGGGEVLPALRTQIYGDLSPDLREQLHLLAADLRQTFGQYTAAAYHFWKGNRTAKAVQVWYPYYTQEIQRGQGDAASAVFTQISRHGLGQAESKALALIQAELYKLQGDLVRGRTTLEAQDWSADSEITLRARQLQGVFLEALGYPDAALQAYSSGLAVTSRLLGKLANLHHHRSRLHLRQSELQLAWREARQAECQVYRLRGELEYHGGRYSDALVSFQSAAMLAQSLDDIDTMTWVERHLAHLYIRHQEFAKAEEHAQRAIDYYQRIGDRFRILQMYGTLSGLYLDAKQFTQAIEFATLTVQGAKVAFPLLAATAAANLAEAYFELGNLAQAQQYAYEVLNMEERHPFPYALFTLGRIKQQQGSLRDAQHHFVEAMRIGESNEDPFIAAYAERELGALYQMMGQPAEANQHLQAALRFFEGAGLAAESQKTKALLAVHDASAPIA